ncbi:hypothetical protein EDD85DRAFT_454713 [Armillaria nabsnona]|nr:hypothetical protein EDD85DRAFT_454713 [Armillaria nabsnona]
MPIPEAWLYFWNSMIRESIGLTRRFLPCLCRITRSATPTQNFRSLEIICGYVSSLWNTPANVDGSRDSEVRLARRNLPVTEKALNPAWPFYPIISKKVSLFHLAPTKYFVVFFPSSGPSLPKASYDIGPETWSQWSLIVSPTSSIPITLPAKRMYTAEAAHLKFWTYSIFKQHFGFCITLRTLTPAPTLRKCNYPWIDAPFEV